MKFQFVIYWNSNNHDFYCKIGNITLNLCAKDAFKLKQLLELCYLYDPVIGNDKIRVMFLLSHTGMFYIKLCLAIKGRWVNIHKIVDRYGMFNFLLNPKYWNLESDKYRNIEQYLKLSNMKIPLVKYYLLYENEIGELIYDLYSENIEAVGEIIIH